MNLDYSISCVCVCVSVALLLLLLPAAVIIVSDHIFFFSLSLARFISIRSFPSQNTRSVVLVRRLSLSHFVCFFDQWLMCNN